MKLKIEVELQPEEIPLATELFNILRQISTFVKPANIVAIFKELIAKLEDSTMLDSVSADINKLLVDLGTECFNDLVQAFEEVVFDPNLVANNKSVVPHFMLLSRYTPPSA